MLVLICLSLLCSGPSLCFSLDDIWENPLNNFFNSKSYSDENETPGSSCERFQNTAHGRDPCPLFLRRFINILLQDSGLKTYSMKVGEEDRTVNVNIRVTGNSLSILQRFGNGEDVPYEDVDASFVKLFEVGSRNSDGDSTQSYYYSQYNPFVLAAVFLLSIASVLLMLNIYKEGVNFNIIVIMAFSLYYVVCVCQSLWKQYEDLLAKKMIALEESLRKNGLGPEKLPDACYSSGQNLLSSFLIKLKVVDDPCKLYWDSKKSIFSGIQLEEAIASPITNLFFSHLPAIGDKSGQFVKSFTSHFAFPLNWIFAGLIVYSMAKLIVSKTILLPVSLFSSRKAHFCPTQGSAPPLLPSTSNVNVHLNITGLPQQNVNRTPDVSKQQAIKEMKKKFAKKENKKFTMLLARFKKKGIVV